LPPSSTQYTDAGLGMPTASGSDSSSDSCAGSCAGCSGAGAGTTASPAGLLPGPEQATNRRVQAASASTRSGLAGVLVIQRLHRSGPPMVRRGASTWPLAAAAALPAGTGPPPGSAPASGGRLEGHLGGD